MLKAEDRVLLGQLKGGSKDALHRIYARYRRELFTAAVSLLGDVDLAEDCLQDVFVRLAESAGQLRVKSNLKAYLATSVVNRARDRIRHHARQVVCVTEALDRAAPSAGPAQQVIADEQAAALFDALGRLPDEQREVFVLHAQAGLTFRQIASAQGVSVRTAHSRYRYAIDKLRRLLGERVEL
ncbi:MAG: sigma-70 family RNA polymerase sigma factor [Phycisphaerales bacterium]|nr:MAG: sigma-70 family RNA polymerase sigma factor [Phycisphaerales bacterium]